MVQGKGPFLALHVSTSIALYIIFFTPTCNLKAQPRYRMQGVSKGPLMSGKTLGCLCHRFTNAAVKRFATASCRGSTTGLHRSAILKFSWCPAVHQG